VLPNNTFRTPPAELVAGIDKPVLPRELMDRVASFLLEEQQLLPQPNGSTKRKAKLGIMHFEDSPMVKAFESSIRAQKDGPCELILLSLGKDAEDAARQLFGGMLRLEGRRRQAVNSGPASDDVSVKEGGVDAILIEGCPDAGLGLAVMERVRKAVGGGGKGLSLTADGERSIPSSFWVDVE
jgi:L-threonylcarbamoyladenylate synthase